MRLVRRISQCLFILFFLYLFFNIKYPFDIKIPPDIFLRFDPLISIVSIIVSRKFITQVLLGFITLLLTIVIGRFFCGWICPLGTILDVSSRIIKRYRGKSIPGKKQAIYPYSRFGYVKYVLLAIFFISALFSSSQLLWFIDPIVLITRSLTLSIYPLFVKLTNGLIDGLLFLRMPSSLISGIDNFLKPTMLPVSQIFFRLSSVTFLIFISILLLEIICQRFWCRKLCPLGGLLALSSHFRLLKRRVGPACNDCSLCPQVCKMGAIGEDSRESDAKECIECMNCVDICPRKAVAYSISSIGSANPVHNIYPILSRRQFTFSVFSSVLMVGVLNTTFTDRNKGAKIIRPPGALPEDEFLDRCIRCNACVKMCAANGKGLMPGIFESGIIGLWSPIFHMRYGYCEYSCNLCGKVCPTQAIHDGPLEVKQKTKIGLAFFDKNRCIPWYKNEDCLVCEEHCPLPKKAITLREEEVKLPDGGFKIVKRPYVIEKLCIGCGICETKCPVPGNSAIFVTPQHEQRYIENGGKRFDLNKRGVV